ncbi:thioredoxin family protein [Hymenobacter psychrotolerans]|uniref:Thioredoxin n=1 Tax=Hymenobacter psychrotolerans DSM 18569 TaxID=1121959 RepID=A0A1M6T4J1_9BACT|nr:thioredoxin family protein [Hymenobacter psychrotolerans]SHK51834.1 hypothetical protein SAMN02746009_01075 [Hymenobacter psychrotolerans DSM 18569]
MKVAERQHVHDVNDAALRQLTREHLKVFAKFTSENCETCELLAAPFTEFATAEEFQHILFVRLDSGENPVAKKMMQEKTAPFFVSYCQGRLLECDMLTQETEMRDMVRRLGEFAPLSS